MPNFDDLFAPQPVQREDTPFDKDAWAAKKQQEREGVYLMIDTYAHEMSIDGGLFRAYLDVQARFDRYSVSNAILVAAQCPEATRLADFDHWKESGVYVKRGADAITILEPGKEYEKGDGNTGVSYNVKKVFDISQTRAGQQAMSTVNSDDRLLLRALINDPVCQYVVSNDLPENINARYEPEQKVLFVRPGLDAPTLFRGLAQELTRAHMDRGGITCENPDFAAYSVSYMLCRRNGVSVEGFSYDHMPESYATMDAKALRGEVGIMRDMAGTITTNMNREFAAHEKYVKNRDGGTR